MTLLNHKLSLYHELKTVWLPDFGYVEDISMETPTVVSAASHSYRLAHGNLAYADPSGRINPSGVAIYDGARRMNLNEYSLNYVDGTFSLGVAPSGAIACSYRRYTVNVFDAFPDAEVFEATDLPIVSLDFSGSDTVPFAIGQRETYWHTAYFVDIFAISDTMKLQMSDALARSLRFWIPLIDFEKNMPLNFDGTINQSFSWESQFIVWMKLRSNPKIRFINSGTTSVKEKYRAAIDGVSTNIY